MRALEIAVPIPDLSHLYNLKPSNFMGHFIGHEGRGSLLSYLKKQGWCNHLSAGQSHDANGFAFFKVSLQLTPQGLGELRCGGAVADRFRGLEGRHSCHLQVL